MKCLCKKFINEKSKIVTVISFTWTICLHRTFVNDGCCGVLKHKSGLSNLKESLSLLLPSSAIAAANHEIKEATGEGMKSRKPQVKVVRRGVNSCR